MGPRDAAVTKRGLRSQTACCLTVFFGPAEDPIPSVNSAERGDRHVIVLSVVALMGRAGHRQSWASGNPCGWWKSLREQRSL